MSINTVNQTPRGKAIVESIIFNVKWILPIFYLGLVFVLLMYCVAYVKGIVATVTIGTALSTDNMEIVVLDFVDVVMIANLVKMIITGSYNSFVSKEHGRPNENISSGTLKIKISTSVIVVCSIHLLRNFVLDGVQLEEIRTKLWIYAAFLATTMVLGILEYLHIKSEAIEAQTKNALD
jgi:uncharacterized protein (TIGR00645 family)